jgi:poly-gamma-glutamate synthase PgsB/CapB
MIIFSTSFLLLLLIYFSIEYFLLRNFLKKIPLRILVNGTRGKSTTVKIIFEILMQEKHKVFAKTTGDKPVQYLPDGTVMIIKRFSPASILENIRLLKRWAHLSPDAVVMESMALQPETQFVLSNKILQPNYILITNIITDHLEVMGKNEKDVEKTVSNSLHQEAEIFLNSNLFTSFSLLKNDFPNLHRIKMSDPFPESIDHIPPKILNQNWNLIKYFAKHLKLNLQITYQCFKNEWSKISQNIFFSLPELNISIWNLFSVNDTQSTDLFIQHSLKEVSQNNQIIFIFNTRKDRPLRTKQFAEFIGRNFPKSTIVLLGNNRKLAKNFLIREGIEAKSIYLKSRKLILLKIKMGYPVPTIIYCIGNFKGMEYFIKSIQELENQT